MPADMKGIIAQTLANMVQQTSIDKITVKALIEACHISRQTFYYHFQDLMDVLEWSMQKAAQQLVERSLQADSLRATLRIFIAFSAEHFPAIRKLMQSQRRAQIEQLLVDSIESYLNGLQQHKSRDLPLANADRRILLRYNACGLVGVLLDCAGKPDLDQEQLALQLERILSGELERWNEP